MIRLLSSVDDVIEALGGTGAVAALAGVGEPAVSNWRARGKISQGNFFVIKDALAEKRMQVSPAVFGFKTVDEARA
jgi:hypothetical protein